MRKLQFEDVDGVRHVSLEGFTYGILDDARGVREKFWLIRESPVIPIYRQTIKNTRILFKFNRNEVSCEDWGEVFCSRIAKHIDLPCVDYYMAELYSENREYIGNGVLCGTYKKSLDEKELSIYSLYQMEKQLLNDNPEMKGSLEINTVNGAMQSLMDNYFSSIPMEEFVKCRNDMLKQTIFDFLLAQTDRHWLNTTVLLYSGDGVMHIRKADCYDNGCICYLKRKESAVESMSREIELTGGAQSPYLASMLNKYCPMLGVKTPLTEINDKKEKDFGDKKIKVINAKDGRDTFLDEISKEILINPEIASFFIKIKRVFFPKENSGAQLDVIEKEFHMAGEEPPAYITKMISNIMGYQFNILNDFVHKKLSEIKKTESSKEGM